MTNGRRKSDRSVVPVKSPNKTRGPSSSGYGEPYPGTKAETPETAKGAPTDRGTRGTRVAEGMEGRGLAKGNPLRQNRFRTPSRAKETDMENPKRARNGKPPRQPRGCTCRRSADLPSALERIRQAARRDSKMRFTALLHHVYNLDTLREAYFRLKRDAAPGVDGQTWRAYGQALEENLQNLSERLKRGAYRAKPVRRVYIAKADGR